MAFTQRTSRKRNEQKSSFLPILLVILSILAVYVFFSVRNIGELAIPSGTYTVAKGTTISDIPIVFKVAPSSWQYKLWLGYLVSSERKIEARAYIAMS